MPSASAGHSEEWDEHPLLGAVLRGTYRIHRVLDRGGMGTVFEAEHLRLHRRLAVKVLAGHLRDDEHALARFNREAEIISRLEHPNVVQVVDFDATESGEPYLVMEYLTGSSLATRLAERGRLDLKQVAQIAYQAALGLNAAHRGAIVHRDLKPANVFLVDVPGEPTLVKLLDFGISKRLGSQRLTGEYDVLGTPDYMPPEQALGRTSEVDARSDQYSLAVIVYECLAGETPFMGKDLNEVLSRVIANDPVPLSRFAPELPAAVGTVLRRAMARTPDGRFENVLEFARSLLPAAGCSFPPPRDPGSLWPRQGRSAPPESAVESRAGGRILTAREEAQTEPPPAPFKAPSSAPADLGRVLDQAREAHGLGDLDLAVNYVESALALADRLGADKDPRLERASVLVESILRSRLGAVDGRLRIRSLPSEYPLLPEQAFLLSRLEGHSGVEEILDLSPLSRRRTLRHLVALLRQGVLALD